MASAFGTETARPSTFCEMAASISCASFSGSLLDGLQTSLTPSSLAACSAPFLTTDQNEPSSECVTMAIVRSLPCVSWTSSPPLSSVFVAVSSPELPHAANTSARARIVSRFIG